MERYDPYAPEALAWPYPIYARLRAEDPVHWGVAGEPDRPGTWYVLRHEDVLQALKDPRLGREVHRVAPQPEPDDEARALAEITQHWMILRDPPAHTRLRALVNKAFTPRVVERMEERVAQLADRLLDAVYASGRMDVTRDLGRPLPVLVIAEVLGVPPEDHALFLPWSLDLAATIDLRQTPEVRRRGALAMAQMVDYLRGVIAERRRSPRDDLLSGLLAVELDGGRLAEDEVLGSIILLLTAGNDPVTYMVGNFIHTLLRHPEALAELREHPERIEAGCDELLRYDSSVQMTFRFALEPAEYGGKTMLPGDHIAVVFGSALRDPAYTPEPDRLDLARQNNRLPYGLGIHFCLGAALARLQGRVAVETVLRRLPDLALTGEPLVWQPAAAVRGLQSLPVIFTPR
jgi:cytochrome P450